MEHALQVLTEDFGPFEWLITWVFLFMAPTASMMMAISSFREKETEQGSRWLIAGLVLTALFGWFLVSYGRLMLELTVRTTGTWVKGVLIARRDRAGRLAVRPGRLPTPLGRRVSTPR